MSEELLVDDNPGNIDIEANINRIANSETASEKQDDSFTDNNLVEYGMDLEVNSDLKGPKINESIAAVLNKPHLQPISPEQYKVKTKKHERMLKSSYPNVNQLFGIKSWENTNG
jgi:hypothetical protein